ncbi:hypothetical protein SCHPADRAFT_938993 [Schizopora paradoxa]|uniref:BTB domain-containing protein n=1 Tax=Schizopora paradoxa TaxID=27342 RepID=A0A0H2S062_9AGAM|nr:hypothetical protein SCHPADRAFT_938993 [Schizopora paradoxa]
MSATLAQQPQQAERKLASSSSVTSNSNSTVPPEADNHKANKSQIARNEPMATLPFPIQDSLALFTPSPRSAAFVQQEKAALRRHYSRTGRYKHASSVPLNVDAVSAEGENKSTRPSDPIPHPEFTIEDGNITFQVGHMTFKLHLSLLMGHSPVFNAMFYFMAESSTEGTDENPVFLPNLNAIDFERFLRVFYPRRFDGLPFNTGVEWHSVFLVADKYKFIECGIRKLAITGLDLSATCVEKIVWGGRYKIKSLLTKGLREACNREQTFTVRELTQLQGDFLAVELVLKKREEKLRASTSSGRKLVTDEEVSMHFAELLKGAV